MFKEVLIMFMVYAILGWFWETPFESIRQKKLLNRGFLIGPILPIYGVTCVAYISSMKLIEPILPENIILRFIVVILYLGLVASISEYTTSYVLELIFKTRWWDYSDRRFNINGRVALVCSLFWGFCGFMIWNFINTPLISFISSIEHINFILTVGYTAFIIDLTITLSQLIKLRIILGKLNDIYNQLSGKVNYTLDGMNGEFKIRKEQLQQSFSNTKKGFNNTIVMLNNKTGVTLSDGQRHLINNFNRLLERAKGVGRFYHNYPNAKSNRFERLLKIVRYKKDHED